MTGIAVYALLALLASALGLVVVVAISTRRAARRPLDPLPAGLKHLAAHVGALSQLGAGLQLRPGESSRRVAPAVIGFR